MSGLIRKLRKVKADATAAPADAQGSEEPMMREASSGNLLASGPPTPSGPMAYYGGFAQPQTPRTSTPNGLLLGAGTPMTAHSYDSHGSSWINQHEAYDIMAAHLFKIARSKNWFSEDPNVASGVALRLAKAQYAMCPAADPRLEGFYQALSLLNCEVAMKVTSPVVAAITTRLPPNTTQVPLTPSEHIQVVETMADLAGARKAQNAAFIRTEKTLVVWCDHVDRLEVSAQSLEDKMIAFVWKSASAAQSASGHDKEMREWNMEQSASQMGHGVSTQGHNSPFRAEFNEKDAEKQEPEYEERVTNLQAPLLHGLAVALDIILCCLLARGLVKESLIDHDYTRLAILVVLPPMFVVILFFCDNIIGVIGQLIAPIRHMSLNSRYYSGKPPTRMTGKLPHITIQMPVYKESLEGVLIPTIESLKKAISTYELQGGTAAIIVSEDGMQLISEEDRAIRMDYYEKNNIGWVARPGHNKHGYVRKGRFKKASNLNFTSQLSLAVERIMDEDRPKDGESLAQWTDADESALYQAAVQRALPELHPKAEAAGNIRMGDLILLIDSDTRVPVDCFLDAASEMSQCPDVGVLQHCSGVMLVSSSYFEKGIGFFTRMVNFSISWVVANGDVAPFMGHNAFLRWTAMQEASFIDPEDNIRKIWSESHVSEDFDMALRLLMKGYITRWATYSNAEFEEGVSLTCDDELNRWQKYAFGCSELVFNPLWKWPLHGPLTPLFRRFLLCKEAPIHYKFSACSYIFSYYAIAAALPLTTSLYLLQGWFYPVLDPVFLAPFQTWIAIIVVYVAGGNVGMSVARYRAKNSGLLRALFEHFIWVPFMVVFFGGMSSHVLTALLAHPVGYNMTWGSTVKDLEDSNFFIEVPAIARKFWRIYLLCGAFIAGMIILAAAPFVPLDWIIIGFTTIWPFALMNALHMLYPIILNPALLRFSF